jgi:hypothetical protein
MFLVRTEVLEERIASIFRLNRISELGTALVVIINRSTLRRYASSLILFTLMMEAIHSSARTLVQKVKFMHYIPERTGSNLDWDSDYSD